MHKHLLSILLFIVIISPFRVLASDFVTESGFVIPENDFINLNKIYDEHKIYFMTEEKYNELMSYNLDFDNVQKEEKYIRTDYNNITGQYIDIVLDKETALNEINAQKIRPSERATVITTGYKRETLTFVRSSQQYGMFSLGLVWLTMPATRSYDVIGARFQNCEVINGTQGGEQIYTVNGVTDQVTYHWNGTNINDEDIGFGISMNLVNDTVSYLACFIEASIYIENYPASVYAAYEHATSNVTLAISKSYTLGAGMGNVFVFSNNYGRYYDGMQGTSMYYSS